MIKCFLIASFTCKCIININNRYHLCGNWYFFTFQSIRIALSIPSFMVPPADFPCGMYQWMILWKVHILNYSCAKLTMFFHNLKFFIGKSARFIQYFFRNTNLTNIMKGRSSCNQSNICLCQRISICYFYQLSQHHLRCCFYMQDVLSTLAVTGSQYITHNPDHDIIIFFFFVNLIINHIYQMLLVHIEAQGILNSFLYNHRIKRSCDIVCDSQLICLTHSINSIFRRYHDHRSFSNTLASFHYFQDFKTIHLWHIDI